MPRIKLKKETPKDSQREKVYNWNRKYISLRDNTMLSLEECQKLTDEVAKTFGFKIYAKVSHTRCDSLKSYYRHTEHKIKMAHHDMFRNVILHEIAHFISRLYNGYQAAPHGPEFMGIYMLLLNRWLKISMQDLTRTADYEDVQYILYDKKLGRVKSLQKTPLLLRSNRFPEGYDVYIRKLKNGNFKFISLRY